MVTPPPIVVVTGSGKGLAGWLGTVKKTVVPPPHLFTGAPQHMVKDKAAVRRVRWACQHCDAAAALVDVQACGCAILQLPWQQWPHPARMHARMKAHVGLQCMLGTRPDSPDRNSDSSQASCNCWLPGSSADAGFAGIVFCRHEVKKVNLDCNSLNPEVKPGSWSKSRKHQREQGSANVHQTLKTETSEAFFGLPRQVEAPGQSSGHHYLSMMHTTGPQRSDAGLPPWLPVLTLITGGEWTGLSGPV